MTIKQEQEMDLKKVETNFQIYDEFPTVKVEQVSQGEDLKYGRFQAHKSNPNYQNGTNKPKKKGKICEI
jgi:hypothetical protein